MSNMTGPMTAVPGTGMLIGPDWKLRADLEAWAGEPDESDGVAIVDVGDGDLRLARVPLCECGDRGWGNVGVQFGKLLAAGHLPALVELLRELPWGGQG